MSRSTFSVLFYVNRGKQKNGMVPVMGRVTINGTQSQFSCKKSIPLTLWDAKGNCAKGRSKEALQLNRDLDNIKAQIIKHYQHLADREAFVTAEMVRNSYQGFGSEYETLLNAFDKDIASFKKRVDNNGKIISDKFERKRSEKIVKQLKDKYGLTYSDGRGQTRTERLHYTERTKFEIQNAVKTALQTSRTWQQFTDRLKRQGVEVEFKRRRGSNDVIEGITFIKDGVRFKGSQIGRQFSYAKLNERLANNEPRQTINQGQARQNEQPMQEPNSDWQGTSRSTFDFPSLGMFETSNPVYDPAEEEFRRRMQRKKKKRGPRL